MNKKNPSSTLTNELVGILGEELIIKTKCEKKGIELNLRNPIRIGEKLPSLDVSVSEDPKSSPSLG